MTQITLARVRLHECAFMLKSSRVTGRYIFLGYRAKRTKSEHYNGGRVFTPGLFLCTVLSISMSEGYESFTEQRAE